MIITVATMKGGSGKSTLASCLAVHWHLRGRRPTLMDADPQRSIVRLAARERALGGVAVVEDASEEASSNARRLAAGGGLVIIDTPGFRSKTTLDCLAAADFLLLPVKPSPFDVDRMLDTLSILIERADGRRAAVSLPAHANDAQFGDRQAYSFRAHRSGTAGAAQRNDQPRRLSGSFAVGRNAEPDQMEGTSRARDRRHCRRGRHDRRRAAGRRMKRKPLPKAITRSIANLQEIAASFVDGRTGPCAASRYAVRCGRAGAADGNFRRSQRSGRATGQSHCFQPQPRGADPLAARRRALARRIVERHKNYAAVGGLVPLPAANIASVTALNLRMVRQLSELYGVPFQRDRTRSLIIALIAGAVPTGAGLAASSTLMWIVPGGLLWGLGVSAITAGALTRGIGLVFVDSFETAMVEAGD